MMSDNHFPKLHNAAWPGVVGKGENAEPIISLDDMLRMTAKAEVDGIKFDGIDLFLADPHVSIDSSEDDIQKLADKIASHGLVVGSVVAPVWGPSGGGSSMGSDEERGLFLKQVRKACRIAKQLREIGMRPHGIVRIDSSVDPATWARNPEENSKKIAHTFQQACDIAADFGESLAAEGEVCWGGMHGWKTMLETLEMVDRPNIGFQADMAHTLLYLLGTNKEDERILSADFQWEDREQLTEALQFLTNTLRPWTIDFHVAQNDGTVHGSGTHDKTGRHCPPKDPNGKLHIPEDAGHWLRDDRGELTKRLRHICWDGCMFSNQVMRQSQTWNDVLDVMLQVRKLHGWTEE